MLTHRVGPSYTVVTALMALILVAGLGVRFASRWLPEHQPNALAGEYGAYLRSVSRQPIAWVPLDQGAFERAARERRLVLLAITSGFSRDSRLMDVDQFTDPEFAFLVNSHFVPIRVDSYEAPGFIREVSLNSLLLEAAGGAMFIAMDAEGNILSISAAQPLHTSGSPPGLIDWLGDLKRAYAANRSSVYSQSKSVSRERDRLLALTQPAAVRLPDALSAGLESLEESLKPDRSSLRGVPSLVAAPIPDLLLRVGGSSRSPSEGAGEWLLRLRESPCYDQVFGGFFVRSRGMQWRNPEFGKLSGRSAQLAEVYAKASLIYNAPLFRQTAKQTLDWILRDLRDPTTGLFYLGVPVSLPSDDGGVPYVRIAEENGARTALTPDEESGAYRLRRSSSFEDGVGSERVNRIAADIEVAKSAMEKYSPPPPSPELYAETNGMVIASLFVVGRLLGESRYISAARTALQSARRTFLLSGDVFYAAEGRFHQAGYVGGYVWISRALLESYKTFGDESDLSECTRMLKRTLQLFADSSSVRCNLHSQYDYLRFVSNVEPVADVPDASLVGVLLRTMVEAGRIAGDEELLAAAQRIALRYAAVPARLGPLGAGLLDGLKAIFEPVIAVKGSNRISLAVGLSQQNPLVCCAPMPRNRPWSNELTDGIYSVGPVGIRRIVEGED